MANSPEKKAKRVTAKRSPTKASPKKPVEGLRGISYESRCSWAESDLTELLGFDDVPMIGRVIVRGDEIAFDWLTNGEAVQHTKLFSADGTAYSGFTVYANGLDDDRARVEATLYSNSRGHILVGQGVWEQEGRAESFIIQLHSGKQVG